MAARKPTLERKLRSYLARNRYEADFDAAARFMGLDPDDEHEHEVAWEVASRLRPTYTSKTTSRKKAKLGSKRETDRDRKTRKAFESIREEAGVPRKAKKKARTTTIIIG